MLCWISAIIRATHAGRLHARLHVRVRTASRPRGQDNLSPANPIAAGANRPPDRVLLRPRGGDLALNPREQLFRFREGQSQIGDIAEVVRLADLHDIHAGTPVPGGRQLQNPLHAPPPVQEEERKYPARTGTPSFTPVPVRLVPGSVLFSTQLCGASDA